VKIPISKLKIEGYELERKILTRLTKLMVIPRALIKEVTEIVNKINLGIVE
jgi:hypothetical protein